MRTIHITIVCSLFLLVAACSKDDKPAPIAQGSVAIKGAATNEVRDINLSILADSAVVYELQAELPGEIAGGEHWITFGVDTTKMSDYRARYGDALLLPATSYYFYKPMVRLAAGTNESEMAQLNIVLQTRLREYATYVLPVIIQSVDGSTETAIGSKVLYMKFTTGKPSVISKEGWAVAAFSSSYNTFTPDKAIDNDEANTYWATALAQTMPQSITINFNRTILFTAVNYYVPPALRYPTLGGYPTSIQIETSMDGNSWTNNGTYAGNIVNNMQTLNTGTLTAKYLRFTSLASARYSNTYDAIFISGIKLLP